MISKDIPLKRDWITLILSLVNRYIQCVGYFAAMFLRRNPRLTRSFGQARHPPSYMQSMFEGASIGGINSAKSAFETRSVNVSKWNSLLRVPPGGA
jgi:hypothetical protein